MGRSHLCASRGAGFGFGFIAGRLCPSGFGICFPKRLQFEDENRRFRRSTPAAQRGEGDAAKVEPFQVAGGECVLVATSDSFFTSAGLTAVRRAVADLQALPQVRQVLWLRTMYRIQSVRVVGHVTTQ